MSELVSIIIPAYNVGPYIEGCLKSVLGQSYPHIEVIVVNDGSTDNTPEILSRYENSDKRVKILSQNNQGPSVARNNGLAHVTGQWIMFVDGDDGLFKNSVSTLLSLAKKHEAEIAIGNFVRKPKCRNAHVRDSLLTPEQTLRRLFFQKGVDSSPWGKLYKKELFHGLKFREGIIYEDLDLIYKLFAKATKIALTTAKVYYYRHTEHSLMNTFSEKRLDSLEVTKRIEEWTAQKYPTLLAGARNRRLSANFNILGLLIANDAVSDYPETAQQCWDVIRRYRKKLLFNPKVRLKNRVGILVSYAGLKILSAFLRSYYGNR